MFGLSLAHMMALKSAAEAYNRKDWDALASAILPLFPSLPDDGTGHTENPTRAAFRSMIPAMKMPAPMVRAAERYLEQASDTQLAMVAANVHAMSNALPKPEIPPLLEKPTLQVMK